MSDQDYTKLLERPADSYEAPKPQPAGSYVHTIKGFKFDKSKDKKTPYVEFDLMLNEPLPDVDQQALADYVADGTLTEKNIRGITFYLTADAMFRLGEFLVDHCGCTPGIPTSEQIQEAQGKQFVGVYEQKPNPNAPDRPYINLTKTTAVPA